MAAPNRWAVREAAEASFYGLSGLKKGKPVVTLKTLKMTEVQTTGETTYSTGGRGNAKLVAFSGNREATVTLQDAIFDNAALEMITGNPIVNGARVLEMNEDLTVEEDGTVTLKNVPVTGSVSVKLLPDNSDVTPASTTDSVVTVGEAGDRVRVYYKTSMADTKTITVSASSFGGTFRLVCDVLVKDAETGETQYGQFIAPRAKINDEFSFNFSPDGDPSVLDIPLELLKDPNSDLIYELVLY